MTAKLVRPTRVPRGKQWSKSLGLRRSVCSFDLSQLENHDVLHCLLPVPTSKHEEGASDGNAGVTVPAQQVASSGQIPHLVTFIMANMSKLGLVH